MSTFNTSPSAPLASGIAICDLGLFQILIPTEKHWRRNGHPYGRKHRWNLPTRRRVYRDHGWAFFQDQIIGNLTGLQLDPLISPKSSRSQYPRLEVGQPLSFELNSQGLIPEAIAQRALFQYQFNPDPTLHYALFQKVIPQFIRIYPLRSTASLSTLTKKFLQEKNIVFKSR